MRFEYAPYDSANYATGLLRNSQSKLLTWKHTPGLDTLVVQTPFGVNAVDLLQSQLIDALNSSELMEGTYIELMPAVYARIVSSADASKGCTLNGEARTYTVFALRQEGDCYQVLDQKWQGIIRPWCDVPLELGVRVDKAMRLTGFLKKKMEPTGFYTIAFGEFKEKEYTNGDLYFRAGDVEIPLTRAAIEQQVIYVRSDTRPEVLSRNAGIKLVY